MDMELIEVKRILAKQLGHDNEDLLNLGKGVFYFIDKYDNSKSYIYIDDDLKIHCVVETKPE